MRTPVNSFVRSVPQQHADQTFPYVLFISTVGAALSVLAVWLAALPVA